MTDSATPTPQTPAAGDRISETIKRLRQLSQLDVQSRWRYYLGDLSVAQATQANWQTWATVSLNARGHIAWAKGQVIWLGQQIVVPHNLQGYYLQGLSLRLALTWWAQDARVFVNGTLVHEGDLFDSSVRVLLSSAVKFQDAITVMLRLESPGHDNGALVRSVCLYERSDQSVNPCPEPSFVADELAVLQEYLTSFAPKNLETMATAIAQLPWSVLSVTDRASFDRGVTSLRQQLQPLGQLVKQRQIQLLGHAHLDLAWLWTVDETWKVAEQTFRSALQLQQDFPELTFGHSTPALYAWIETHRPDLFAAIRAQIAAGRWEVMAGLWIEPELNLASGESIVRQVLYGQRYVQEKFGRVSKIAWLPDTFGFCWQLPQILKQGGVDYFATQKLRWNDTTTFPYDWFWWKGLDGSQILSMNSAPIGEGIDPVKMARYARDWEVKTGLPIALWLPGVGDHGGGPTRDMLEVARRWQQSPFFPTLEFTTMLEFLEAARQQTVNTVIADPQNATPQSPLPTWNDELYLEFHRGCYTTHADQKWLNRRCEEALHEAELFASLATLLLNTPYPKADLETAWKQVLFNQFHDILPGSSIPEVFVDANQTWNAAAQTGWTIRDQALQSIAHQIQLPAPPHANARAVVVFNQFNWQRSEVVQVTVAQSGFADPTACYWQICDLEGRAIDTQVELHTQNGTPHWQLSFLAKEIPGCGYRSFWLCPREVGVPPSKPTPASSYVLENEFLQAIVDPTTGNLSRLFDKVYKRDLLSRPANQLQAFQDQGQYWDAWNINPNYAQYPLPAAQLAAIQYDAKGTIAMRVRVVRKLGQSTFNQVYALDKGSALLKIHTQVDWRERHVLVKAAFPLNMDAAYATYEIPYGAIQRSTRPKTAHERSKWEVPALRWADLSDTVSNNSYGFSVLSDCKHGYDSQPNQIRLTLLRGSEWPDPKADLGLHQFTYALYPHDRTWQAAQTVRRGYELNQPLRVLVFDPSLPYPQVAKSAALPSVGQFFNVQAENLILSAFKQSEDNANQWVIRCYECHGRSAQMSWPNSLNSTILGQFLNPDTSKMTTLLEQPSSSAGNPSPQSIAPWSIATFVLQQS